jgi:hypothetical protein
MYLHAVTISDISTDNGLFLTNPAWSGTRDTIQYSKYQWPRTHRPGNSTWQLWQEALQKAVLIPQATDLRIRYAIGHWTTDTSDWKWFTNDSKSCLYHHKGHIWRLFEPRNTRSTRQHIYHAQTLKKHCRIYFCGLRWKKQPPTRLLSRALVMSSPFLLHSQHQQPLPTLSANTNLQRKDGASKPSTAPTRISIVSSTLSLTTPYVLSVMVHTKTASPRPPVY